MEPSSRRKACDLCFRKKIRCDGLKPTCSNCSLYQVSCKTTTIRKGRISQYKRPPVTTARGGATEPSIEKDSLDARLARIEAKLDSLRGPGDTASLDRLCEQEESDARIAGDSFDTTTTHTSPPLDWASPRSRDSPCVPPLMEALPVVQSYFQNYNSLIPLFDEQSFMRLMDEYYKPYGKRSRIYGAIINVVLSLGHRVQVCELGDAHSGFNDMKIKACVDNAQLMLDELMTRDQDTLGLQALLGLVILYQTQLDQTAASVLMSAAMRLAHSLRLESKTALSGLSPQEARQRTNIFWICYILDKDVSLRTVTPSLQMDSDIDIYLPGSAHGDYENLLYSVDGLSQFHLFRARVQLAHLEGRIYDSLFSNRSRKLSREARLQAVLQVNRLLDRWEQSVPIPFRLENMSGNLLSGPLVHMTVMYQTYLMCLTMTHGLYTHDSPWLKALGGLGRDLLRSFNPQRDAPVDGCASSTPAVWEKCVTTSRAILKILSYQSFGGCSVWLSSCAYFSAMTFIFVNLIYYPTSKLAGSDEELAEVSMLQLQKYFDYKGLEKFRQLRNVLVQIESMAKSVLKDTRLPQPLQTTSPKNYLGSASLLSAPPHAGIFDTDFGQDLENEGSVADARLG